MLAMGCVSTFKEGVIRALTYNFVNRDASRSATQRLAVAKIF